MKNLIIIVLVLFFNYNSFSQTTINTSDLIGYWKPNQESSQLFFWKNTEGVLQVQDICGSTGEPLTLIEFNVNKNNILLKEVSTKNNWVTVSVFIFIDKTTLQRVINGNVNITIIYTKIK